MAFVPVMPAATGVRVVLIVCVEQATATASGATRNSDSWRRSNATAARVSATMRARGRPLINLRRCDDESATTKDGDAARAAGGPSGVVPAQPFLPFSS